MVIGGTGQGFHLGPGFQQTRTGNLGIGLGAHRRGINGGVQQNLERLGLTEEDLLAYALVLGRSEQDTK